MNDKQINPNLKPKKIVWISCRANEDCPGKQAEILTIRSNSPTGKTQIGSFGAAQAGQFVRYRCLTCNGVFTITT